MGTCCRDDSSKSHCLPLARLKCYCGDFILMQTLNSRFSIVQVQQKSKMSRDLLKTPWQHIFGTERSLKWSLKAKPKWPPAKRHPTLCTNQLQEVQVAPQLPLSVISISEHASGQSFKSL